MPLDRSEPDARVFSIPPDAPFLPVLVEALLDGRILPALGSSESALAGATIYLPTRRAARAFQAALAARFGGRALLLPRVVPLGDADDLEFDAAGWTADDDDLAEDLRLPPLPPLERRLILTRLVRQWSGALEAQRLREAPDLPRLVATSPAEAVALAGDLEGLMDSLATEGVPWSEVRSCVDADFSSYFENTTRFLDLASEYWPAILRERDASDPTRRRNAVIRAEAARLRRDRPAAPIVAAGSTGSIPATADLLAAIARLPNGAVVLPGLDTHLDAESWDAIGGLDEAEPDPVHGHPQALLRRLLIEHLRIPREGVGILTPRESNGARGHLLSEAMRPAETTDRWVEQPEEERLALAKRGGAGIAVVEASDEREEAMAVAIALRETLAQPGRNAALVTPDRGLARRVTSELQRWGIIAADSAGSRLLDSDAGRLARLAADAAARDFHPAAILALLTHPGLRLGLTASAIARARTALEIGLLRGPIPRPGVAGLRAALQVRHTKARRPPRPEKRLAAADWACATDLLGRLEAAFAGFTPDDWQGEGCSLGAIAARHALTLEALARPADGEESAEDASAEDASAEAVAAFFDDLAAAGDAALAGRFAEYPAFFAALIAERTLPPPRAEAHARVGILGLLEARLLSADRMVLGGLDEGIWPPKTETDAFLNRPMRARLGLSAPERRIGQTAHDFVQLLGGADVVVTRARKRGGRPTVRSRFLERLKAFSGPDNWQGLVVAGERYRRFAQALDRPARVAPLKRPEPRPGAAHFPRRLNVTDIENLVRDPYSIFAKHILRIDALDGLAVPPGPSDRGTIVHDVFGAFVESFPDALPPDADAILAARAKAAFAEIEAAFPELYAQWWPRFVRVLPDYLAWEAERRLDVKAVYAERTGELAIPLPDGTVLTLRARADRIEEGVDGSFRIVDFKTGQVPTNNVVAVGFSPQLTLEAAMLMKGSFAGIGTARETPDLLHVKVGTPGKGIDPKPLKPPPGDPRSVAEIVQQHADGLRSLAATYVAGDAAYLSRPYAKYARRYSDYDHLARVKEWSVTGGTEDETGE